MQIEKANLEDVFLQLTQSDNNNASIGNEYALHDNNSELESQENYLKSLDNSKEN